MYPFVAVEAVAGGGKTAVRKHLFERLSGSDVTPLTVNEISWLDPASARTLTSAFYQGAAVAPEAVLSAFVADKTVLAQRLIGPHRAVRPVIADRYVASDLAYQESMWQIPPERAWPRYVDAGVPLPDVVVFLDRPKSALLERLSARSPQQRAWWESAETVATLHDAFNRAMDRLDRAGTRIVVVDTTAEPRDVLHAIDERVLPILSQLLPTARKGGR